MLSCFSHAVHSDILRLFSLLFIFLDLSDPAFSLLGGSWGVWRVRFRHASPVKSSRQKFLQRCDLILISSATPGRRVR